MLIGTATGSMKAKVLPRPNWLSTHGHMQLASVSKRESEAVLRERASGLSERGRSANIIWRDDRPVSLTAIVKGRDAMLTRLVRRRREFTALERD